MEMSKNEKIKRSIIIVVIMLVAFLSIMNSRQKRAMKNKEKEQEVEIIGNYNIDIIKLINAASKDSNYLISPYNIEVALNMLREGADGKTKEELDKVLGSRKINDVSIKDKLHIANAIFIKNEYKNGVKKDYVNILKNNYKSEVLYDNFESPDVINNWVKKNTNDMIDKVIDNVNKDFVMALASAVALDVEWTSPFECNNTREEEFNNGNSKLKVEMMHQTYKYDAKYIKNDDMEGIILPYETNDKNELEFVAILPYDGVNNFVNNLTEDKLVNITRDAKEATNKLHVNLSLPRFTYSYEVEDFIKVLKKLGIKEAFDQVKANFTKMIELDENVYVGEAVHKTKIELNEKGTKAAAVTYFGMFKATGMIESDFEEVDIKFNKPFIYMIREKMTNEILFFGEVFEPNKWNGSTCSNKE